jgi:hypothetical protein
MKRVLVSEATFLIKRSSLETETKGPISRPALLDQIIKIDFLVNFKMGDCH